MADVQTGANAFLVSACGQETFIGGDPNHVASAATATRECRRNDNQYTLPRQLVSPHSSSTTSCTSAPIHHPGFRNPANAACAYYHHGSDTPLQILCPPVYFP